MIETKRKALCDNCKKEIEEDDCIILWHGSNAANAPTVYFPYTVHFPYKRKKKKQYKIVNNLHFCNSDCMALFFKNLYLKSYDIIDYK